MTNLEREIKIFIDLVERDPQQFAKYQQRVEALKKSLEGLNGASVKGTNAEDQFQKLSAELTKQEQAALKSAVAQQKLAEAVAKTEQAQARAAKAATEAAAAQDKASSDAKRRSDEEAARLQKTADLAKQKAKAEAEAAEAASRAQAKAEQNAARQQSLLDANLAANRRLAEINQLGAEAAINASRERGKSVEGEANSIKQLQAELRVLTERQREANDAAQRFSLSNAIKSARAELTEARRAFETEGELQKRLGNESRITGVNQGIQSLQNVVEKLVGGGQLSAATAQLSGLESVLGDVGKAGASLGPVAVAITAAAAATAGLVAVLKSAADAAAEYSRNVEGAAAASGLTEKAVAGVDLQFRKIGEDSGQVGSILSQFGQRIEEAKAGGEEAVKAFQALGVSLDDLRNKNPDEILFQIADGIQSVGKGTLQAKGLGGIFGDDDATKIARIAKGLRDAGDEAERLGIVLSDTQKQDLRRYQEALGTIGGQLEGIQNQLGSAAAPALTEFAKTLSDAVKALDLGGKDAQAAIKGFLELLSVLPKVGAFAFGPLISALKIVVEGFNAISDAYGAVLLALGGTGNLGSNFDALSGSANNATGNLSTLRSVLAAVGETINALAHPIDTLTFLWTGNRQEVEKNAQAHQTASQSFTQAGAAVGLLEADLKKLSEQHKETAKTAEVESEAEKSAWEEAYSKRAASREQLSRELARIEREDAERRAKQSKEELDEADRILNLAKRGRGSSSLSLNKPGFNNQFGPNTQEASPAEIEKLAKEREDKYREHQKNLTSLTRAGVAEREVEEKIAVEKFGLLNSQATENFALQKDKRIQLAKDEADLGIITYTQAADAKLAAEQNFIDQKRILLQQEQADANTGAERKKQIDQELVTLSQESERLKFEASHARVDAQIQDEERKAKQAQDENNLQIARNNVLIAKKKEQGATEDEIARIEERNAQLQLNSIDAQIDALRRIHEAQLQLITDAAARQEAETRANLEVIPLEAQRVQLAEALRQAHLRATAAIAGSAAAGGARNPGDTSDPLFGAPQDFEESQRRILDAIKAQREAGAQAFNGLGTLYTYYANLVGEATKAGADQITGLIDKLQADIRGLGNPGGAQIQGLLNYFSNQAKDALQAAYKRRDELAAADAKKQEEEAKRQAEARAQALQGIADRYQSGREQAEKRLSDSLQRIREQEAEAEKNYAKSVLDEKKRLAEQEDDLAQRLADKLTEIRKRQTEEDIRTEEDRLAAIRDIRNGEADDDASRARDRIKQASDLRNESRQLEADLATAQDELNRALADKDREIQEAIQKKAPQKDIDKLRNERAELEAQNKKTVDDIKARQKEIAEIQKAEDEKKKAEDEKNAEIEVALNSGKTKEEIEALVEAAKQKFNLRVQEIDDLLEVRKDGDAKELAELQAFYAKERARINEQLAEKLRLIALEIQKKKEARAQEFTDAQNDYQKQLNDARKASADRLQELADAHKERMAQFKVQRAEAQKAYQDSLNDLNEALKKSLAEQKISWQEFANFVKGTLKDIGGAAKDAVPPSTGGSPTTGPSSTTGGGSGGGSTTTTGPANTGGGNQAGPTVTTSGDPTKPGQGGPSTQGQQGTGGGGEFANSAAIADTFITQANNFERGAIFPTLKDALYNLDLHLNGLQQGSNEIKPDITKADYDRAKAAIKAYWSLRNVWEQFRRHRLTASRTIDVIDQIVLAGFATQAEAKPFRDAAAKFINEFGKNTTGRVPSFDSIAGTTQGLTRQSGTPSLGADTSGSIAPADIREGGLTVASVNTGPANLTTPPGPTPIPGPMQQGSDFGKPITGNYGTGQYGNPVTGNYNPGPGTSQYGNPVTGYQNLTLVQELFADIKAGKRDTSYGASAIADWFNKGKISKILYDAAYARLLRYSNGDKSALDNFTGTNIYGNQVGNYQSATVPPPAVLPQAALNLQSMVASVPSGTTFAVDGGSREYQDGRLPLQRADAPVLPRLPVKQGETGAINMTFNGDFFTEETVRSIQGLAQGEVQKDIGRRNRIIRNATKGIQ